MLRSRFGHRPLALRFERSASGLARPSSSITNFDGHGRARARLTVEREGSRHALLTRWLIYTGAQEEEPGQESKSSGLLQCPIEQPRVFRGSRTIRPSSPLTSQAKKAPAKKSKPAAKAAPKKSAPATAAPKSKTKQAAAAAPAPAPAKKSM